MPGPGPALFSGDLLGNVLPLTCLVPDGGNDSGAIGALPSGTVRRFNKVWVGTGGIDCLGPITSVGQFVAVSGPAGTNRDLDFETVGSNRWSWRANSTAESGADAGSNLELVAWKDDGVTVIDRPITCTRAAGGTLALNRPTTIGSALAPGTPFLTAAVAASTIADGILTIGGGGTQTGIRGIRSDGTAAVPTAVISTDILTFLAAHGFDGTAFNAGADALITLRAAENFAVGAHGTRITFGTTPLLTAARVTCWQMEPSGHFFAAADNTFDVGANNANRPRTGYFATGIQCGGVEVSPDAATFPQGGFQSNIAVIRAGGGGRYFGVSSNGTIAVPTALTTGNLITSLTGRGYDGTTFQTTGGYLYEATENWANPGNRGSRCRVQAVKIGTNAVQDAATFDADGAAGQFNFTIWDVTAGALVRPSRGPADSGGAGFRMMVVPN